MKTFSTFHYFRVFSILVFGVLPTVVVGQLGADLTTVDNTNCNGAPCDYDGPSILINELMMSPNSNDGSLWGTNSSQKGEWIELYNPNICESIDISCFYLGNNANDSQPYPGGYVIPSGTVVPPAGFALIRGENAPPVPSNLLVENGGNVVELVVTGAGVCIGGGNRLWFPNAGGWFAFYDNNGIPQDAVSWGNQSNLDEAPCVPTLAGCGYSGSLPNYTDFPNDRKNFILNVSAATYQGQSLRRIPDGGIWSGPGNKTYGTCNATCVNTDIISCNGTATATPSGGTPPYTYLWDDFQAQTTQTADQLCAGQYCVTITDALGNTVIQCVTVEDVVYDAHISAAICESETYTLPDGTSISTAGDYPVMFQTVFGCDSLITVHLDIYSRFEIELNPVICANQTYTLPDGTEVTNSGTYQVDFQTVHGCDSIYIVNLTVNPLIEVILDAEICAGESYVLPDGTSVSTAGQYQATVSGQSGSCDTTFTINLAIAPHFQIDLNDLTDVTCFGNNDGSVSLGLNSGGEPYTYSWSDGEDHGGQPTDLVPGNYTVEVTNADGCKSDTSFLIQEPAPLVVTAWADELICFNAQSDLGASASGGTGNYTYHWSHDATEASNCTVSPSENTDYLVFASDENGCLSDTAVLSVEVINMFDDSLGVSLADSFCVGGEIEVSAQYNGQYPPYTYTWNNGLVNGSGPFTFSPDSTTVYSVTVTDGCGNEVSGDVPAVVWDIPEVEPDSIANVTCFGLDDGFAHIGVAGGEPDYEFNWSDGQDHGATATGLAPGIYGVYVSDAHGCKSSTGFVINEPLAIGISLTADTLICIGEETQLLAQATGGTGSLTYHWGHTLLDTGTSIASPDTTSTFTVYAEDANHCVSSSVETEIEVIAMDLGLLTLTADTTICPGEMVSLLGSYTGNFPPYTYQWSDGLGAGSGPHTITPSEAETYVLEVSDKCDNSVTADVVVQLYENPKSVLPDTLLAGCSPYNFELFDPVNTQPGYEHHWQISNSGSFFGNPVNAQITEPGIYQLLLEVTSPDGCTSVSETTIPIEVYPVPAASFTASKWTTGIDEPEIQFMDESTGSVFNFWTIESTIFENTAEVEYSFSDTGYYAVHLVVENEFGCRDSITKWVTITIDHDVTIPNAFLPGGVGVDPYYVPGNTSNMVFYPFVEFVEDYQMRIFNRWGEVIFMSTELQKGWNGTYHEKPCPQDVYVYRIDLEFTDGKRITKVGDVTLLR